MVTHDFPACATFRGGMCTCDEADKLCPGCGSEEWDRITDHNSPGASFNRCNRCEYEWTPSEMLETPAEQALDKAQTEAYAEGRKDEADENGTASRLIDAWVNAHGKPIPWEKAVEIVAIVNKLPDTERQRLLALDAD